MSRAEQGRLTAVPRPPPDQCGIILHPAGHTRSPAMHNAAFAALGLQAEYRAFDVPPEGLADAIQSMREREIRQLAVSIPHKQTVMAHLDEVEPTAEQIGAVNTITLRENRLVGSNTDWLGAIQALERETTLPGQQAVVLGAGGAARAVVYALCERGAEVLVLNRTVERARDLCQELGAKGFGSPDDLEEIPHSVLVNTTSVGLSSDESPVRATSLRAHSVVMDAVYEPAVTRLLRDATERGATPIGGKWMLVYQAAHQLKLWTGLDAPLDVMASAFDED